MVGELNEVVEKALKNEGRRPRAIVRLPVINKHDWHAWRDLVSAIGAIVHIHETVDKYVKLVIREVKKSPTISLARLCGRGPGNRSVYPHPTSPVSIPLHVGTMVLGTAAIVGVAKELDLYPAEAISSYPLDPNYSERVKRLVVRLPEPVKKADSKAPEDPDVHVPRTDHYWIPRTGAKRAKHAYRGSTRPE